MKNIGTDFIKGTKYPDFSTVDMIVRVPEPPLELPVKEGAVVTKLPSPKRIKAPDLQVRDVVAQWEPVGYFARSSMTLKELSFLLWSTQGFRKIVSEHIMLRNVPSSGSRYPMDTYFVAGEVEGLPTGLYRYLPESHSVVLEREGSDVPFEMATASMNFKVVTRAAVIFLWVATPYRSTWALGNRGYRSVLIEAGHICQALITAAACYGFEVAPVDLFHDDLIMKLADLDPETQWPVYLAAVGKVEREL